MSNYWMLDFTEFERQTISLLMQKDVLTPDEAALLSRWNTARNEYEANLRAQIESNRADSLIAMNNRAALVSSALNDLENLADYYTAQYENSIGGVDIGEQE